MRRNISTPHGEQPISKYRNKIANSYLQQKKAVLTYLNRSKTAQCMRQIELGTGVPVYIVCRILDEFQRRKIVEIKYDGVSKVSGFPSVHHYGLVSTLFTKGGQNGTY
ncbi:hypothetical protein H8B06_18645 [Sphingobacterium sp. DN00404]|uniref:Uncharacterized protein n=1 Tax=Sphingobacterium micropteri TaxID=2763501 RepID=A0ABR7YU24_9SPHI|nr:hypothetical protein [Sphingobacterium micropteri]MBD1434849.1 hypothetical protein [Sphingobacterium micropteri]